MKLFWRNILIFLIPVPIVLVVTLGYYIIRKHKVDEKLSLIAQNEILLMGDSQIQRIDPSLFPKKTFNLATSGEAYYFTFQKLEKLLNFKDNKVKTVILGYSIHNFAPVYTKLVDLKTSQGSSSLAKHFYFLDIKSSFKWISSDLTFKKLFTAIYAQPEWGGLRPSKKEKPTVPMINKSFRMHYGTPGSEVSIAIQQRTDLTRIDSLCKSKSINLVLLSTPYHPIYKSKIDSLYLNFFEENVSLVESNFHINYLDYEITTDLMSDANHLNSKGSKLFTNMIIEELNEKNMLE